MKLRFSIREWFWRVPTFLWVFLAITQFVNFVNGLATIPRLEKAVTRLSYDLTLQQKFVEILAARERELILSLFFTPLFLALAKIRSGRGKQSKHEGS